MSCQRQANQVSRKAATLSGISRLEAGLTFALGAAGLAGAVGSLAPLLRDNDPLGFAAGVAAIGGGIGGALIALRTAAQLRARKKPVTRHVVVDRAGQEIGWSYRPAVARAQAKKEAGAQVIPVTVKVDFDELQHFIKSGRTFQRVRARPPAKMI